MKCRYVFGWWNERYMHEHVICVISHTKRYRKNNNSNNNNPNKINSTLQFSIHRTDHRMHRHTMCTNPNICCPIQLLFQFFAQFLIFSNNFLYFHFRMQHLRQKKKSIHKMFDDSDDDGGGGRLWKWKWWWWCGDGQRHQNFVSNAIISGETIHNKFNQKPLHPNGNKLSAFPRFFIIIRQAHTLTERSTVKLLSVFVLQCILTNYKQTTSGILLLLFGVRFCEFHTFLFFCWMFSIIPCWNTELNSEHWSHTHSVHSAKNMDLISRLTTISFQN